MRKYNVRYALESCRDYSIDTNSNNEEKKLLAEYINQNFNNMDENELKILALKCLGENNLKKILLNHELNYFRHEKKHMTLDQFKNKAQLIFNRYQNKAGGFLLEDIDWVVYDHTATKYDINGNELLFENAVDVTDDDDTDTDLYLKNIVEMLQSLTSNIEIEIREKYHKKGKLVSYLIWCTDKTIEGDAKVGL